MKNHICKSLIMLGLLLGSLGAVPQVVLAHAFPDHSEPRVGAIVESPPVFVRIWFDGALESAFTTIVVQDSSSRNVDRGNGGVNASDPTLLEVELGPLPPGTYRVVWDVLARDGHRTKGDYTFTVK
jgi:methionine-rich copper-binding protein CopC